MSIGIYGEAEEPMWSLTVALVRWFSWHAAVDLTRFTQGLMLYHLCDLPL
jgi:hypothetical protein